MPFFPAFYKIPDTMEALRILLVEDDPSAALDVEMLLAEMGYQLMGVLSDGGTALSTILEEQPDFIILDIELKGKLSGIDIAREIKYLQIPVIFTTSFADKQLYEQARDTFAFGYIVKPFDKLTLQSAIEQAVKALHNEDMLGEADARWKEDLVVKDSLLVKHNNILYKVFYAEILFVQGEGNYCTLHTKLKKYVVKSSMRKMLGELPGELFCPAQKSFIVNLLMIDAIDTGSGKVFIGENEIPLGRNFKNKLLERFKLLK